MGVTVVVGPASKAGVAGKNYAGVLLQYPNTDGSVVSYGTPRPQQNVLSSRFP
jgi:hypothetical protein